MSCSNKNQKDALSQSIKKDRLSHAYIICGGDDVSRQEYIKRIVAEIFCLSEENSPCGQCANCRKIEHNNMEDLIQIFKDGNSIKVDQIRELSIALSNKPFTLRTVVIINDADSMTPESQNKLLKSLEEPAPGTVIILSAGSLFALYPTIRSRCVIVNLGSQSIGTDPELEEHAANIVKYSMSNKPLDTIFAEVKECADSGSEAEKLLDSMEVYVRDIIVGRYSPELLFNEHNIEIVDRIDWNKGFPFEEYLKHIETAKMDVKKNINWKYTMKNLIINFKQEEAHG